VKRFMNFLDDRVKASEIFRLVAILLVMDCVAVGVLLVAGCVEMERVPVEVSHPTLENVFAGMKLVREHSVENFTLFTEYSTSYDTSRWRITGSKEIRIRVWPSGTEAEVMIEHVHIDCSIRATQPGIDGLIQDSMDDSIHGGLQPGFWITPDYPYENHFAIEGFSQWLREGWMYFWSGYGYGRERTVRLTEEALKQEGGAYASQISVVYDLLIRYPGEEWWHTRCLMEEILIPLAKEEAGEKG